MCLFGFTSTSQAAVIVYFQQVGLDVTATWIGTLKVSAPLMDDTSISMANNQDAIGASGLHHRHDTLSTGFYLDPAGSVTPTTMITLVESPSGESNPSFGFSGNNIVYNNVHITGGLLGAVSELTFIQTRDVMKFSNTTLAALGASSLNNTLAWTATTTGDTIRLLTGTPVPEPSSILLIGFGNLALLARRRRS